MSDNSITIPYLGSNAEHRSYSLLERLRAGTLLFAKAPRRYLDLNTAGDFFRDAVYQIFNNPLYMTDYIKPDPKARGIPTPQKIKIDEYYGKLVETNSPVFSLSTAGYWNPLAWLEALSLFWVNWATNRYNPLTDGFFSRLGSYFHITLAGLVYATSKTLNLIATPLSLILLVSAALALGATFPVQIALGFGILVGLGSWAYHSYKYWKLQQENGSDAGLGTCLWFGAKHMFQSFLLGIGSPLVRLFHRGNDLRKSHPELFWTGMVLTTLAVLAIGVFPYVGAPAFLGYELGTYFYRALTPALNILTAHFELTSLEAGIFKTAVTAVTSLGVVDLISRAVKEVGGWWDSLVSVYNKQDKPDTTYETEYPQRNGVNLSCQIDTHQVQGKPCLLIYSLIDSQKSSSQYRTVNVAHGSGQPDHGSRVDRLR